MLAHGYNYSVDWWGLGVLTYVLLTGRQPFSSPKTDDPMVVMRRIVDENYTIKYPPFLSMHAKVGWAQAGLTACANAVTASRWHFTARQRDVMTQLVCCIVVCAGLHHAAAGAQACKAVRHACRQGAGCQAAQLVQRV